MSSSVSDSAELAFLKNCRVLFHTVDENPADERFFTIADLNESGFNIDEAAKNKDDVQTDSNPSKLRWFHISANNMAWVNIFMEKWFQRAGGLDKADWEQMWELKVRPGLSHPDNKPLHSRHMEPSCTMSKKFNLASRQPGNIQAHELDDYYHLEQLPDENTENTKSKQPEDIQAHTSDAKDHSAQGSNKSEKPNRSKLPLLALYLPYMNLDIYNEFSTLNQSYKPTMQPDPQPKFSSTANRKEMENSLSHFYLKASPLLHPRRTLDQFHYGSLNDTSNRDKGQVISKWTGKDLGNDGRTEAANDSLMIMVDQLWCWVLDDKTILSCFPSDKFQYSPGGFTDIYNSMKNSCCNSKTVWDLFLILVKEATSYLFRQDNKSFLDLVETFRPPNRFNFLKTSSMKRDHQSALIDIRKELELLHQVADIIDELKMIRNLADKQREVLKSLILALRHLHPLRGESSKNSGTQLAFNFSQSQFFGGTVFNINSSQTNSEESVETTKRLAEKIEGATRDTVVSADETLLLLIAEVDKLTREGENTHKMLLSLLDLKQTTAALMEARSTTQQGRVIMLFTIITIIFLQLSFFTSYFGQNISQLTGDTSNPTSWELWRVGTPISIFVIVIALLIAYRIRTPSSRLWFWQRFTTNSSA